MTAPHSKPTVGWKVASLSFSMASVRYRAMLPLLALEHDGFQCRVFSDAGSEQLLGLDLLVIVKSFSSDDFALAQQAVARGIPVVLDLCDNILGRSFCALGDGATSPITSAIEYFRDEFIAGTHTPAWELFPSEASALFAGANA